MKIERRFTRPDTDVYSTVEWEQRTSRITHPDGTVVFEMKDSRVPASWSQLATDIMVSKYFRKAGVPQVDAQGHAITRKDGSVVTGPERSAQQVIHRLCGCWKHWGAAHGFFDSAEDGQAFYDELAYMLLHQIAAPNSPQWFNTGLKTAYGISGPAQGHYIADPTTGEIGLALDAFTHPQPHACFIQSVQDDLVKSGGIMDLWTREARLFKYGSGTGTNFSQIRGEGEPLSGGGTSSGLMSWLRIGDRAAGAIKSGGTTRRAAKMVCLDLDHPDIHDFVNWKVREELKVAAMVEGLKALPPAQQALASDLGLELNYDFNGEAYLTVSGQNSNNSIRIPDEFFDCLDDNRQWVLYRRTDGKPAEALPARDLWNQVCFASWRCADPGVQYDSTINAWHTCPETGRINASNPCSEYMFLDNTACNLASINLVKFYDPESRTFDVDGYEYAIRLWTIVLEISVLMAAYPSAEIAKLSYEFRTLGLGFANIGAMLMQAGIPYDSDEARALCACLSAILTGRAYAVSAEMAHRLGSFKGFDHNRQAMLRVIRNHRRAAHGTSRTSGNYDNLRIKPVPIDFEAVAAASRHVSNADALGERARKAWDEALDGGERYGYRNAQTTVIAPTGTIGLLMDCDTTGVEPDFALVKFKKLAGGGYFKIVNNSLQPALKALGYTGEQITEIIEYVLGKPTLDVPVPGARGTLGDFLKASGFRDDDLEAAQSRLPSVFELHFAFSRHNLREGLLEELGIDLDGDGGNSGSFNLLIELGLTTEQIQELNLAICGTQKVEGAPHLRQEHLPVFDCANKCGKTGRRFIKPSGHIHMMAAAQPFISGAISKTINLPHDATVEDIASCYRQSWELGLKANALYRDGCKLSQPLNTKSDEAEKRSTLAEDDEGDEEAIDMARSEVAREVKELASVLVEPSGDSSPVQDAAAVSVADNSDDDDDGKSSSSSSPPKQSTERVTIRTVEKIVERIVERPLRRRLPDTRHSLTHKFNVAGHEGYLTVGLYVDGNPGELFITMSKEGSTIGGLMDSLGTAISVALQYGVPLESLVGKFSHQRFEPAGMTSNRDIPFAKSLVDYIFRWLGMQFIPGYRAQNAPRRPWAAENESDLSPTRMQSAFDSSNNASEPTSAAPAITSVQSQPANGSGPVMSPDAASTAPPATYSAVDQRSAAGAGEAQWTGGVDDPQVVRAMHARQSPLTRLQTDLQTATAIADRQNAQAAAILAGQGSMLDHALAELMSDAPVCDQCGTITVRSGTCYKCLNCGNSMGCS